MSGPEPAEARVSADGRSVDLTWSDGFREALPVVWLCDNAREAFDEVTGQRRLGLSALDTETRLSRSGLARMG